MNKTLKFLGLNFLEITAQKKDGEMKGIKINTSMEIKKMEKMDPSFLKIKEDIVKVEFIYGLQYNPDFAKIELKGQVLLSDDPKKIKELIQKWKNKKLENEFNIFLVNLILRKCSVKALSLEEELGLPFHINIPKVDVKK